MIFSSSADMKPISRRRNLHARGFSLVEIAMVLAIGALILAGVMLFFATANQKNQIMETLTEISAIRTTVASLSAGQQLDESADWETLVATSGLLPAKWVKTAGGSSFLQSPWKSYVNVQVVTVNNALNSAPISNYLTIYVFGLSSAACNALVTTDLGQYYTQTDNTLFIAHQATPDAAAGACSGPGGYVWFFFPTGQ